MSKVQNLNAVLREVSTISRPPARSKPAEDSRTPGRYRAIRGPLEFRKVLECGCPLPLWNSLWARIWVLTVLALCFICGCCTSKPAKAVSARHFDFQHDTFSFPNQLLWEYFYDTNGNWVTRDRDPKPTYWQHCFVLASATKQFFMNARFVPEKPIADDKTYRKLIRRVVSTSPRHALDDARKIEIPGYPDLRSFSRDHEPLLKTNCGGAWHSYFQRGHWRIVFPFSRKEQEGMSKQLLARLRKNEIAIIHLVRFPQLTINHAVVLFDARESGNEIQFINYDPNDPQKPRIITYDRGKRTFSMAANDYFPGGRVDVYEVDHRWNY